MTGEIKGSKVPEPQPSRPQSLKEFAEDWKNRWAEWDWVDDHNR